MNIVIRNVAFKREISPEKKTRISIEFVVTFGRQVSGVSFERPTFFCGAGRGGVTDEKGLTQG